MKTEVVMKRELFGMEIKQKSKSEFFSSTDLVKAGNRYRVSNGQSLFDFNQWKNSRQTKEFISVLKEKYGTVIISGRGRGKDTWVHPFLFLDIALSINPNLKVEVYEWLFDSLLKYRNESGDSYKKMAGALYEKTTQKTRFYEVIKKVCDKIKIECGVKDWNSATDEQLKLRDRIHEYIYLLVGMTTPANMYSCVDIAINKAKEFWRYE